MFQLKYIYIGLKQRILHKLVGSAYPPADLTLPQMQCLDRPHSLTCHVFAGAQMPGLNKSHSSTGHTFTCAEVTLSLKHKEHSHASTDYTHADHSLTQVTLSHTCAE